ncbi:MAG: hypothetical protein U0840_17315 [Gemmataceae bacterium]
MNDRLDALIRDHLDRQAETIDPRPHLVRLQRRLHPTPARRARWAWPLAAAAAVMAAFLLWQGRAPAQASAESLLRETRQTYHLPLDRCYRVELEPVGTLADDPPLAVFRTTRLWTRGDRFFVESVGPRLRWAWGRDEAGQIWMALGSRRGVRIDPDEVPRWLQLQCDLLTLRPEPLLGEILAHFHLHRETSVDETGSTREVIHATRRFLPRLASLRSATLEIDPDSKVLRRLTLERVRQGNLVARVRYTLVETQPLDPARYDLAGHLDDDHEVYTRDHRPQRRLVFLKRWFGPWFRLNTTP